jgi:hypothetical protein
MKNVSSDRIGASGRRQTTNDNKKNNGDKLTIVSLCLGCIVFVILPILQMRLRRRGERRRTLPLHYQLVPRADGSLTDEPQPCGRRREQGANDQAGPVERNSKRQ